MRPGTGTMRQFVIPFSGSPAKRGGDDVTMPYSSVSSSSLAGLIILGE